MIKNGFIFLNIKDCQERVRTVDNDQNDKTVDQVRREWIAVRNAISLGHEHKEENVHLCRDKL